MKIYQLHQYGGSWEDAYDDIIGTYLHKEKAEEAITRFKEKERLAQELNRHCNNCPMLNSATLDSDKLAEECAAYCNHFVRVAYDDRDDCDCENWLPTYEKSYYRIEEVEVEE